MKRTIKKYTVNTKEKNEEGNTYILFENLKKARERARKEFRNNNLVSLLNFKRIPLSI